jgi:predicted type IV restriction endonuclease|tara:strand:- start:182 stop:670 length:489 start_codon:yes stop_codon:yes gene_type:complete
MEKSENNNFDFIEGYDLLKEKYGLPEFDLIARDFDAEKILEKETNFIVREVRIVISEKLSSYLNLFENLINPSSPPMFIFSILRNLNPENKEAIKDIYKKLSKLQIEVMKLDTLYEESREVLYVKKVVKEWQNLKVEIYDLIDGLEKGLEEDNGSKNRGYFG